MTATILAESRRGGKTVIIERLNGESGHEYRVTISERFHSLPKAREAFLASTPPSMAETLSRQIAENNKSSLTL